MILCPSVKHEEGHVLGFESWAERGWCRLERMARNLSREDGFLISVQVAVVVFLTFKHCLAMVWLLLKNDIVLFLF